MKKLRMLSLILVAIMMASCSDDDEIVDNAKNAVGTYSGYTVAGCKYFSNQLSTDQTVAVTYVSVDKVSVNYESDTWGSFSIADATVTSTDNGVMLNGSGVTKMGMSGSETKEYVCDLTGTIINGVADLEFSCPAVMGGLTISFCQGDVPASVVVPGSYTGYTKADCAYFQGMYADEQVIKLEATENDTYKATYTSDTWGEFTVEGITAVAEGNTFVLSGEGVCIMGMGDKVSEYACTFSGTIDLAKETPTFSFNVPAVMGGLTIEFNNGEMPQE